MDDIKDIRTVDAFINKVNKEVFHFTPLYRIEGKKILYTNVDENIEAFLKDGILTFLLDNISVLRISVNELETTNTTYVTKRYIREIHKRLHMSLTDYYFNLLRKLTDNTLFYDNLIYILNKELDTNLVYDMEGYCNASDNSFSLYTDDGVIELSYMRKIIYKIESVDQLPTMVKDVKLALIKFAENNIIFYENKIKAMNDLKLFYEKSLQ